MKTQEKQNAKNIVNLFYKMNLNADKKTHFLPCRWK